MNDYTIYPRDWDFHHSDDKHTEWTCIDDGAMVCFHLRLNKKSHSLNLYAESLTYYGDSVYYYDVISHRYTPYLEKVYSSGMHRLHAKDADGYNVEDVCFICDENDDVTAYITIPEDIINWFWECEENDAFAESLAYEFSEFAEQHYLAVDDSADVSANIEAYLARNVPGCSQYGFADVPCELADAVEHFFYEYYKPRTRYAA